MQRKRLQQIKTYSRILKYKRATGEIEEVTLNEPPSEPIEEELHNDQPQPEEFQDEFEDEFEKEEGWVSDNSFQGEEQKEKEVSGGIQDEVEEGKAYLGSNKHLGKGEVLQFENQAYDMLHRLTIEWPSLSIDFVGRSSPFEREPLVFEPMIKYPFEVLTVQGSCNNSNSNSIYLTKWLKLHQTKYDDVPPEVRDDDDADYEDEEPQVVIQQIATECDVNRLRTLNNSPVVAFWSEKGEIHIVDLSPSMEKLKNNVSSKKKEHCQQIVLRNGASGWALNWNTQNIGELLTGDNDGSVQIYKNDEQYSKWVKTAHYTYHKSSVEDVIYSPEQPFVFASCSADGTLQIVDTREGVYNRSSLLIRAHEKDVNVCDWNKMATHLIVTGSDDCTVKVWDLRMSKKGSNQELLCFNWHTEPITSIRFQPNDEAVIAVASEDNRLSIWDMSVQNEEQDTEVPNELMFLHQGQEEIKEICFHPIYNEMIISSAIDSINIFKPCFDEPDVGEDERTDLDDLKGPPIREQDLDSYLQRMSLNE